MATSPKLHNRTLLFGDMPYGDEGQQTIILRIIAEHLVHLTCEKFANLTEFASMVLGFCATQNAASSSFVA